MKKTEESIIDFISKSFKRFKNIEMGIGDDCAVFENYAITKDIYVEGTHFTLNLEPEIIGWRTFAGAISDIAAIGGKPIFFLFGLGLPNNFNEKFFKSLLKGIIKLSNMFQVQIIGGDTVKSEKLVLCYTVIGKIKKPIYRNGAKKGDFVYITGDLGGSRLGYEKNVLNKKFMYPLPKINEVKNILKKYKINSMIDISDGLVIDATRISMESKVRINILSEKIPLNKIAFHYCLEKNIEPIEFCINSGEEYEILFTSDEEIKIKGISKIGFVSEGRGVYIDGKRVRHKGFEHFNED